MGYLHIDNLYKAQEILVFKTCFALEKIHGTSANVQWKDGHVLFSSGGERHERFAALFDIDNLKGKFLERFLASDPVIIYGEAYGGKQQGMSKTYGTELRFAAFDVKVGDSWLSVPQAFEFVTFLGLEFVAFKEISTDLPAIDAERDEFSVQAIRNGVGDDKLREGVVLRPPFECTLNNGKRVITKHKREEFSERGTPKLDSIDPSKRVLMENAGAIALEWVTPMRLTHVLDRLVKDRDNKVPDITDTKQVIELMVEDVTREATGEILDNRPVRGAISARAAKLFRELIQSKLYEQKL